MAVTEHEIAADCGGGFGPSHVNEPCHGIIFFKLVNEFVYD